MATNNISEGGPLRVCDLCGGVDDHPRHVVAGNVRGAFAPSEGALDRVMSEAPEGDRTRLVRELMDTTSSDRHLDCCRSAGCPDGSCALVTEGAEELRGGDLLDHLTQNAEEIQARLAEDYQRRFDAAIQTELLGGN